MRCGWSHTYRHTHGRRGKPASPAPWVLTGPQPGAPATSRPKPPAHRKGPVSSPGTGPGCPECGLPVLPTAPAAASWPSPAPGVSTLPAGGLGLSAPAPRGSSRSSGLAGPPGSRWVPRPRHSHPSRAGSLAPAAALLPSVPCACGPPGRGAPGHREARVCPPTPTPGASLPLAPLDWVSLGPSGVTVGCSHLAAVTPSSGSVGPSPAPRPGQPAVCSVAAAEMGPRLPLPPGLWGLLRDHKSPGAEPARPPVRGAGVWPTGVHRGEPTARPQLQRLRPGGSPALAPGGQVHLPLGPPAAALPGAPSRASLGGWRARRRPRALPPPVDGGTRPLCEGRGGRSRTWPCPSGRHWPAPKAQGLGEAGGSAVGSGHPEAQEVEG